MVDKRGTQSFFVRHPFPTSVFIVALIVVVALIFGNSGLRLSPNVSVVALNTPDSGMGTYGNVIALTTLKCGSSKTITGQKWMYVYHADISYYCSGESSQSCQTKLWNSAWGVGAQQAQQACQSSAPTASGLGYKCGLIWCGPLTSGKFVQCPQSPLVWDCGQSATIGNGKNEDINNFDLYDSDCSDGVMHCRGDIPITLESVSYTVGCGTCAAQ